MEPPLTVLIPRLWPFLSHNSSSVRKSTLSTLKTLTNKLEKENSKEVKEETNAKDDEPMKSVFSAKNWPWRLLQDALRHIFQRILVEANADVQQLAQDVWQNLINNADLNSLLHASCPYMSTWMCMAMQPSRLPFDGNVLIRSAIADNCSNASTSIGNRNPFQKLYLGGSECTPVEIRELNCVRARVMAAKVLGSLSRFLIMEAPGVDYTEESPIECYTKVLMNYLNSRSAIQRLVCGLTIAFWAREDKSLYSGPKTLVDKLNFCLVENVYYDEVALLFTRFVYLQTTILFQYCVSST